MLRSSPPGATGLYQPENEHDSCGIALVAKLWGEASHAVVEKALEALENLEHRGAQGADPNTGDTMQMAIYATLGVFLLLAVRKPAAYRSVIAFAAWSSFAHAVTMGSLGFEMPPLKTGFISGSLVLVVIGAALLALLPKPPERMKRLK